MTGHPQNVGTASRRCFRRERLLTRAFDTGIVQVGAVGVTVEDTGTAHQAGLVARALDMTHPDLPAARTVGCPVKGGLGQATAHLQAHHVGLPQVPAMVADRPPLVVAKYLDSSGAFVASIQ